MKLRLPHKFQAALMAALASVSFTTLSTGSTAQAATQQLTNVTPASMDSGNSNFNWSENTGNLSSWCLTFNMTSTSSADFFNMNAGSDAHSGYRLATDGNDVILTLNGTDKLARLEDVVGRTNTISLSFVLDTNGTSSLGTGTFTLSSGSQTKEVANLTSTMGGNTNTYFYKANNQVRVWTNSKAQKVYDITLAKLDDNVITFDNYTWAGTAEKHDWSQDVWTGAGTSFPETDGNAVFGDSGHQQVSITTAITAHDVTVSGQNYTFNLTNGGSLTANALTVEGGNQTVNLSGGAFTPGAISIASGATLSTTGTGSTVSISSLAGAGAFNKGDGGTTTLTSAITDYTGTISVTNGKLNLGEFNHGQVSINVEHGEVVGVGKDNGTGIVLGTINIGAGGKFTVNGHHDIFGWGDNATAKIVLQGDGEGEGHLATLHIDPNSKNASATMTTPLEMKGYAAITTTAEGFNTYKDYGVIKVSGTHNTIQKMNVRKGVEINVAAAGDTLEVGTMTGTQDGNHDLQKTGAGSMTVTGGMSIHNLTHNGGSFRTNGSATVNNLTLGTGAALTTAGTVAVGGTATLAAGSSWTNTGSNATVGGNFTSSGALDNSGTMTLNGGSFTMNAGAGVTNSGTMTVNGDFTMAAGTTVTNTGAITFNGAHTLTLAQGGFANNTGGSVTLNSGTIFNLANLTAVNNTYTLFSGNANVDLSGYGFSVANITGFSGAGQAFDYGWTFGNDGTISYSTTVVYGWNGTQGEWMAENAWTKNGEQATFASSPNSDAQFDTATGESFVKSIAVNSAVVTHDMTVGDAYTFTLGNGTSITANSIKLDGEGASLTINGTGSVVSTTGVSASGKTITVGGGVLLQGGTADAFNLDGSGTYALGSGASALGNVALADSWHGTLKFSNVTGFDGINLDGYGNTTAVEFDNVSGYLYSPGNGSPHTFNTKMVLGAGGLTLVNGNSNYEHKFAGGVEGSGDLKVTLSDGSNTPTYHFNGSVQGWTGNFILDGNKTVTLVFEDQATEVNAGIQRNQGTLNVNVGDGTNAFTTTFHNTVGASALTVKAQANATFNETLTLAGNINLNGNSTATFQKAVSAAALAVGNTKSTGATATFDGDLTLSGGFSLNGTETANATVALNGDTTVNGSFDLSNGQTAHGTVTLASEKTLDLKGNIWMSQNASLILQKDATAKLGAALTVMGLENGATIARPGDADQYNLNNSSYTLSKVEATINSDQNDVQLRFADSKFTTSHNVTLKNLQSVFRGMDITGGTTTVGASDATGTVQLGAVALSDGGNLTLAAGVTGTTSGVTVTGTDAISGGTLKMGADAVITMGASGALTLSGIAVDLSAKELQDGDTGYTEGQNNGNGFAYTSGKVQLVDFTAGGSVTEGENVQYVRGVNHGLLNQDGDDKGYVTFADTNYTAFFVNMPNTTERLSAAQTVAGEHRVYILSDVYLNAGTLDTTDVEIPVGALHVNSGAGTVSLTGAEAGFGTLDGSGTLNSVVNLNGKDLNIAAGDTLTLEGGATITYTNISNQGTLGIGANTRVVIEAADPIVIGSGKTFNTTGEGTLEVLHVKSEGGAVTIGSKLVTTKSDDRTKGVTITNPNGSITLNGDANIAGAIYLPTGTLVVGDGSKSVRVEATKLEVGDTGTQNQASTLTVNAKATLHIKKADIAENYNNTGMIFGEWNGITTANIYGSLYAENTTAYVGDTKVTYNIESGGVMAVKGIGLCQFKGDKSEIINLHLKDGGKLVLGANGISSDKEFSADFGHAEVGMTADTTLAKDITLTRAQGTTFNTTKYEWTTDEEDLVQLSDGSTGGTMTVSGNLSGSGKLIADGAGTLVLSGTNTHTGGTVVNGGTLQAASAGALGNGDVTVNGGTLELTTTTAVTGALTLGNNSTLVFAGADMLTAGSLALADGVTNLTFNLNSIVPTTAGTITLATGTNGAADLSGVDVTLVWDTKPTFYKDSGVKKEGNSWVITLENEGRELIWNGSEGTWSREAAMWHTATEPGQAVAFNSGDSAIFGSNVNPAYAMLAEAVEAEKVTVQSGATVTLLRNIGAEAGSLTATKMEVAGNLSTSVNVTAAEIVGNGTDATWTIGSGTAVTVGTLAAEEGATLTFSGQGTLTAGTITGEGTIAFGEGFQPDVTTITVAEGKELALSGAVEKTVTQSNLNLAGTLVLENGYHLTISDQFNPGTAGVDLNIRNNAHLTVSLGSADNVLNMDAASTGDLHVGSGTISYLSELGVQTVHMAAGTTLLFGLPEDETQKDAAEFTNDIVLDGNATVQVYGSSRHTSATISGDVTGAGYTLTKADGDQTLTFSGVVNVGGLTTANNGGGTIQFAGGEGSVGSIVTNGPTKIQFSAAADPEAKNEYSFTTFNMAPSNGVRWLVVDKDVKVSGTGNSLGSDNIKATINGGWNLNGGGLDVNGSLVLAGAVSFDGPGATTIKGSGDITATALNISNGTTTTIQGGVTINIVPSDDTSISANHTGIFKRAGADSTLNLADATLAATTKDWEMKGSINTVNLTNASTGTAFNAADGRTITLSKAMGGSGKLVKAGEGTVLLTGANTYSGGTVINAGTLAVAGNGAIGAVTIGENGILRMDKGYNFSNTVSGAGKMTYAGEAAATLNFSDKDISEWTGSFENQSSAEVTLNITKNLGRVNASIGSASGAGAVNITSQNDVFFDNVVNVKNVSHTQNHTLFVETNTDTGKSGKLTATGTVTAGRLVVGETANSAGTEFILSGADAQLGSEHTYGNTLQGYGTFAVVGGARQTLSKLNASGQEFHGTLKADGEGSVLTVNSEHPGDMKLLASGQGTIELAKTFTAGSNNTVTLDGGVLKLASDTSALVVDSTVDLSSGTLNQTAGSITVNGGKSLTLGNANISSAINSTGAVTFTQDITATGLTGDERDYFMGLDGQKATVANFFAGTEEYLTVVTGGTVTTNNRKVTQGGKDYLLDTDGTAAGEKNIDYTMFYQMVSDSELTYSDIADVSAAHGVVEFPVMVYTEGATLNVDRVDALVALNNGTANIDGSIEFAGILGISGGMDNLVTGQIDIARVNFAAGEVTVTKFQDAAVVSEGVRFSSNSQLAGVLVCALAPQGQDSVSYSIGNDKFSVVATELAKTGSGDVDVKNSVSARNVHNSGQGVADSLTLSSGAVAASLKEVTATSGDIEFLNMAAASGTEDGKQTSVSLNKLEIGAGKTVSFYEAAAPTSVEELVREAAVTVAGTLTAGEGAKLNANLVMASGSTLDVSATGGAGLLMGSTVTLNTGMTLNDYSSDWSTWEDGTKYALFTGVDGLDIGSDSGMGTAAIDYTQWVDAQQYFTNIEDSNRYFLCYEGAPAANAEGLLTGVGTNGANVGMVYIMVMPEPTTSTLSLLALCALAARRRRK